MRADDFLKLDTWVLVEKEWPNPLSEELFNTGRVLGPFLSEGEANGYAMGLGVDAIYLESAGVTGVIAYIDKNQAIENKDYKVYGDSNYARYFWFPEKLEK